MFTQTTLKPKDYTQTHKKARCQHGLIRPNSHCIQCNPDLKCSCGSNVHRVKCCHGLELFKKRQAARMVHKGQQPQGPSITQPSLPPPPPPSAPLPAESPPKKMRKVIVGGVEMQVEKGSTMTIGGVSVVLE